jgi:hypothetical protein
MPLVTRNFRQLSDLVLHENDLCVGQAREVIFVDVASDVTVPMGTVVFRAKAATDTSYAVLSNASQLVVTNEFGIVFGDHYGCKDEVTLLAADTADNAVAFVRGPIQLKDWLVEEAVDGVLNATQFQALVHLLKAQNVILENTVG